MKRLYVCLGLVTAVLAVTFALTVHDFLAITQRVPADILVVEGWGYDSPALAEAVDEFKRGEYKVVLTVGGPAAVKGKNAERVSYAVLAADRLQALGVETQSMIPLQVPDSGGSGYLDSFCQFISGAWRIRPTQRKAVQAGSPSTRDRACVRQARDAA